MSMSSKISNYEEDSASDSSDDEYDEEYPKAEKMKESDNQMSMEELLALEEKNRANALSKKITNSKQSSWKRVDGKKNLKRANKNRPCEFPLQRRTAPRMNYIDSTNPLGHKDKLYRDPRFDDLSGQLDITAWKMNYDFLEEKRKKEFQILKNKLKKAKKPEKKSQIKQTIQRMENQDRERAKKNKERELKRLERENAISQLKEGRTPRYTSKKEKYISMKMEQFNDLQSNKKVEKYLERKEKKKSRKFIKRNF